MVIEQCGVCLDTFDTYSSLPCGHGFCEGCTSRLARCPLCRTPCRAHVGSEPGSEPDFDLIQSEHVRIMVRAAYRVLNEHQLWDRLRNVEPSRETGFAFSQDQDVLSIMRLIVDDPHYTGHSGASIGQTMQMMYLVARRGFAALVHYLESD